MADDLQNWRPITPSERALLMHLLRGEFQGKAEVLQQVASAEVARLTSELSLSLRTDGPLADVRDNDAPSSRENDFIPVEGFYYDAADHGRPLSVARLVRLALHVTNGKISELEIYKEDGSPIITDPYDVDLDRIYFY